MQRIIRLYSSFILFSLFALNMDAHANEDLRLSQMATDFTLLDQKNNPRTLSEMKGEWMVLYFYPKNETPG